MVPNPSMRSGAVVNEAPAGGSCPSPVRALLDGARRRGIPLAVLRSPPGYPWGREFLLVRPDQHIAWRARQAAEIDLDLVTSHASRPARTRPEERV